MKCKLYIMIYPQGQSIPLGDLVSRHGLKQHSTMVNPVVVWGSWTPPSRLVLWLIRWCAFRLLLGAGMSKVGVGLFWGLCCKVVGPLFFRGDFLKWEYLNLRMESEIEMEDDGCFWSPGGPRRHQSCFNTESRSSTLRGEFCGTPVT